MRPSRHRATIEVRQPPIGDRAHGRQAGACTRRVHPDDVTLRYAAAIAEADVPVRVSRRAADLHPTAAHVEDRRDAIIKDELVRLFDEHLDPACRVEVRVVDGDVTLRGRVSCSLARMVAEDLVYGVPGVRDCLNVLRVTRTGGEGLPRRPLGAAS